MHTSQCATLSLGDEMLLDGMSLVFAGVSHNLKLTSRGSHLSAISHYISFTVCIAMPSLGL